MFPFRMFDKAFSWQLNKIAICREEELETTAIFEIYLPHTQKLFPEP